MATDTCRYERSRFMPNESERSSHRHRRGIGWSEQRAGRGLATASTLLNRRSESERGLRANFFLPGFVAVRRAVILEAGETTTVDVVLEGQ